MTRLKDTLGALVLIIILTTTGCNPGDTKGETLQVEPTMNQEAQTLDAEPSQIPLLTATEEHAPSTKTPLPSPTVTLTATITPSPTISVPMLSVTENTHCRSGPGSSYDPQGVLLVGEEAEIIAQSTIDEYWYIKLPSRPERPCWLSALYAQVEGDTSSLPSFTPMPSPTPEVGYDLFLNSFQSCGSISYVVFSVQNLGSTTLMTANVEIIDFETRETLYGPEFRRHPFAQVVMPVCPPDHGNHLFPGEILFVHIPIDPVPHGHTARGTVMLCTGDYLGGECTTREIYFFVK